MRGWPGLHGKVTYLGANIMIGKLIINHDVTNINVLS